MFVLALKFHVFPLSLIIRLFQLIYVTQLITLNMSIICIIILKLFFYLFIHLIIFINIWKET